MSLLQWQRVLFSNRGSTLMTSSTKKCVFNRVVRRNYAAKTKRRSVIMTQTVEGIGEKGEEIVVAPGFARNYLFPKNYAILSTPEAKEEYKPFYDLIDFDARRRNEELKQQQKRMSKVQIIMRRHPKTGSAEIKNPITAEHLSEKMWIQYQIEIDPSDIVIPKPFLTYGEYTINIKVKGQETEVPVKVMVKRR